MMLNSKHGPAAGETPSQQIENRLNEARQALAAAKAANDFAAVGANISTIIGEIDAASDHLTNAIADEAVSIDRSKANALRAERSTMSDLLTDAEMLDRLVSERQAMMRKAETDAEMLKLQEDAETIREEATKLILALRNPLQQLIDSAEKTSVLGSDISGINNKLRAADRNELCVHGALHAASSQGHPLTELSDILFGAGFRKVKAALFELERAAPLLSRQGSGK
jgi:hypothetical protein